MRANLPKIFSAYRFSRLAALAGFSLLMLTATASGSATFDGNPDLIISDIWQIAGNLCYQVQNIGTAEAPAGHDSQLYKNDVLFSTNFFDTALLPGERSNRCFAEYSCTDIHDKFFACADVKNAVGESDENNNCREEIWVCDQTPTNIIKGPLVLDLTDTSARIYWETDKPCKTELFYSNNANQLNQAAVTITEQTIHEVQLANLSAGAAYQFQIQANNFISDPYYFQLSPTEDSIPPQVETPDLLRIPGPFVRFQATLPASDDQGVDRVEFFLDDNLIGTDYSEDENNKFGVQIIPGALDLSHIDFFKPHTLTTIAHDRFGLINKSSLEWTPEAEPMDGELDFLYPDPDYVFYVPEDITPYLFPINFGVHAAQYTAELCPPAGIGGDLDCRHVSSDVKLIRFNINGETWSNNPTLIDIDYTWLADSIPVGDYVLTVEATADDDRTMTVQRTIHIHSGVPNLVMDRAVTREGQAFRVNLILHNQGTLPIEISTLEDSLTGFQVIDPESPDYSFEAIYVPETRRSNIHVDFRTPAGWYSLAAGEILNVSYLAVPILSPAYPFEEFSIGTESVRIETNFEGSIETRSISLLRNRTTEGISLMDSIEDIRETADYLIVTNPVSLGYLECGSGQLDMLLDRLAELAMAKWGMLAYLEGNPSMELVDDAIEAWGRTMRGSDGSANGFLRNGYLLLVGETNIIPAGAIRFSGHWWWDDQRVGLTDAYYADTASNMIDPELMVGRITGDHLDDLLVPVETILNVTKGTPGYSYNLSNALLLSGWPTTRDGGSDNIDFSSEVSVVAAHLAENSIPSEIFDTMEYDNRLFAALAFIFQLPGTDILHLSGHGSPTSLDDIRASDLFGLRDAFVGHNPLVYASSCNTGRFTEPDSLGEKFLQAGAGAYFGSTEPAYWPTSQSGSSAIFHRLTHGRAIGSIIKEVKTGFGSDYLWGFIEDYWTAEFNLFGDPEYGGAYYPPAPMDAALNTNAISDSTIVSYFIPAYTVTTQPDGTDWVNIPGGYWLQEPGYPIVPDYTVQEQIAAGYQVQEVRLLTYSFAGVVSYLNLPVYEPAIVGEPGAVIQGPGLPDIWPGYHYSWQVSQNPDQSSTLTIQIYPFWYYYLSGDAEFHQDFTFEIITAPVQASISSLSTDKPAYLPGEQVNLNLMLYNDHALPEDVLLVVDVHSNGYPHPYAGLPMRTLESLAGVVSVDLSWAPDTFTPGDYFFEVELRTPGGDLIDSEQVQFKLGLLAGEIGNLSISPQEFHPGETVMVEFDFTNTGSQPISGQAVAQILGTGLQSPIQLTEEILDLPPTATIHIKLIWQTPQYAVGAYRVVTYVQYDPLVTAPLQATVQAVPQIFLPMIRR